jgi:hypothetical protein
LDTDTGKTCGLAKRKENIVQVGIVRLSTKLAFQGPSFFGLVYVNIHCPIVRE